MGVGFGRVQDAKGDIARAAGHIEQSEVAPPFRAQGGNEGVLPGPMQPKRHQVIHQIIAPGDLVEDIVDKVLLVLDRHALESERRLWLLGLLGLSRGRLLPHIDPCLCREGCP